jgi:predicted RNA methylase
MAEEPYPLPSDENSSTPSWSAEGKEWPRTILDIGCGTGVVGLMLAQRFPCARVIALDIEANAIAQTNANIIAASPDLRLKERMSTYHASIQDFTLACQAALFSETSLSPDQPRNIPTGALHNINDYIFITTSNTLFAGKYLF